MVQLPGYGHEVLCLCGGVEVGLVGPSGASRALGPEVAAGVVPVLLHPIVGGLHVEHGGARLRSVLVSAGLYTNTDKNLSFLCAVLKMTVTATKVEVEAVLLENTGN